MRDQVDAPVTDLARRTTTSPSRPIRPPRPAPPPVLRDRVRTRGTAPAPAWARGGLPREDLWDLPIGASRKAA